MTSCNSTASQAQIPSYDDTKSIATGSRRYQDIAPLTAKEAARLASIKSRFKAEERIAADDLQWLRSRSDETRAALAERMRPKLYCETSPHIKAKRISKNERRKLIADLRVVMRFYSETGLELFPKVPSEPDMNKFQVFGYCLATLITPRDLNRWTLDTLAKRCGLLLILEDRLAIIDMVNERRHHISGRKLASLSG